MVDLNTFPIEVEINSPINITSEISAGVTIESAVYNGARGRSAYEVWIGKGYIGSEEDFLQWLRIQTAAETTLLDIGNHYNSTNVEDVLQEVAIRIEEKKDKHYKHIQGAASDVWIINHNLDKYPSVTIIDSADRVLIGEVFYGKFSRETNEITREVTFIKDESADPTKWVTVSFAAGFSGKAYLN